MRSTLVPPELPPKCTIQPSSLPAIGVLALQSIRSALPPTGLNDTASRGTGRVPSCGPRSPSHPRLRDMDVRDFETIFRDSEMGVRLSWDALGNSDITVKEIYSRSREMLAGLHTVWYVTPDGKNGDWRNGPNRPLRVGEVIQTFDTWPAKRVAGIDSFRKQFEGLGHPIQLTLPVYAPNDRDLIILDGTHRAVAAYLAQKDVRLLVFALRGPRDPGMLPDLTHYSD